MQQVTAAMWKTEPIAEQKQALAFTASYSPYQFEKIKQGFLPQEMEDKWFIYFQDDQLYFHRSWTGSCIYILKFIYTETQAQAVHSWWCGDRDSADTGIPGMSHEELISMLIESFLLNRND